MLKLSREVDMLDSARQKAVGAASLILAEQDGWRGDLRALLVEEILPSVRHGKIAFFLNFDKLPVGFIIWAHLSEDTEKRLLSTLDPWLHLSEWNEGSSIWIRWLHLPKGFRRDGLRLCLAELFPAEKSVRMIFRRRQRFVAMEYDRSLFERLSRLSCK